MRPTSYKVLPMETNGNFFADKVMDLANYGFAALIFGEMAGHEPMRWQPIAIGLVFFIVCAIVGLTLRKKKRAKEDG